MGIQQSIGAILRASFQASAAAKLPADFEALLARLTEATSPAARAKADRQFKQLMTAAIPGLRSYARNLCRDEHTADDLVQDTMVKAWAARERFTEGTNFKAWTYTILRNQFLSQMRRKRFTGEYDEAVAEMVLRAPADQDRRLHVEDVERAMARLPEAQREALLLVGAEELTYEEVAAVTDVPLGTVKSRVARGRTALARLVEGEVAA